MTETASSMDELGNCDLIVDAVYRGGRVGNAGDDPLGPLLGVSNQGGFRHLGKVQHPKLIVLTTSMSEPDWPDHLDLETGILTYYGDNREPGCDLHATRRWGNSMLKDLFARSRDPELRNASPPVLVFKKAGIYRDAIFLGLAVPGALSVPVPEELVATWHHSRGMRFQNYRAIFTILNVPRISRSWINDIRAGNRVSKNAPSQWIDWVTHRKYSPLRASPTSVTRGRLTQLPRTPEEEQILQTIRDRYAATPTDFERCAARIAELLLKKVTSIDLTRPTRDGGRDATGAYKIGFGASSIEVEFAMEAKCYSATTSVGVEAVARLISRLRHRQFGILITTSYVHEQAYKEIIDDGHPIIIVSGADIVEILRKAGIYDVDSVRSWMDIDL